MCMKKPKIDIPTQTITQAAPVQVASYDNQEALDQADLEARLRRRRAGAAANILTSPTGIPATSTMGGARA